MAGGDLDGDLYFVCWKQSLLPNHQNFSPMDYEAQPKKIESEPITSAHMTKFVVDYIRSDQLGVIDNTHKALADQEKDGIRSDICLYLAMLHSLAVDAPKTGNWPKMPRTRLKEYPDFMMKSDKPKYHSERVLGKLYRRCQKFKDAVSEKHNQKMRVDESFLLPGYHKYFERARELYLQYRNKMESLMRLYGIDSEAEVFTGCFLKLRNRLPKEKPKIAEIVGEIVLQTRHELRRKFFEDFGQDEQRLSKTQQISDDMRLKASAWYAAAYTYEDSLEKPQSTRLLGFPWVVDDIMLDIKRRQKCSCPGQDVCATIGESLVRLLEEDKKWLLEDLKERIRVKKWAEAHLKSSQPNLSIVLTGSSRTLLFHHKSDLDICVLPKDQICEEDLPIETQVKTLEPLARHLKYELSEEKETENLFYEVRLLNKTDFPVLACKKPTDELTSRTQCSPRLICDLTASKRSLLVCTLLYSYVEKYPYLFFTLRLLHRWCCVTGISRSPVGSRNTSNVLATLFLAQHLQGDEDAEFQKDHLSAKSLQFLRGKEADDSLLTKLEKIIRSNLPEFTSGERNFDEKELDMGNLGQMLMAFFQSHETLFQIVIPEHFAQVLGFHKCSEELDEEHLVLIREQMQRAHQLLAQYGDVQIMLACCSSEDYSVIFLSPLLSFSVKGVEKSKAQEIARKTGAASVVIRPSVPRYQKSTILEVRGNEPVIRAVERELEKMTVQASRDKWSLMGSSFVDGAGLMLFEGSRSVKDEISLTPYDGPCHQTHDKLARHLAFVRKPTCSAEYMLRRYTERFLQQAQVLERDFDPQLHGRYEYAVYFGRMYLFSIPHVLLEDGESVTIAMLKANKLKTAIEQRKRVAPQEIHYVNQEQERDRRRTRRPKRATEEDESVIKKRKRAKPSRSSFFTVVHSPEKVRRFLQSRGFRADDITRPNTYLVDIYREDVEFGVRFDHDLKFLEVKFPNLRWCLNDVKRMWQRSENHAERLSGLQVQEEVTLDGRELDIRFLLQSRFELSPSEVLGTNYEDYTGILEPADGEGKRFSVRQDLWKDVRMIRFTKTTSFSADVSDDFVSGLTVHLDEVTEMSRPAQSVGQFKTEHSRWEVSVTATLPPDLSTKEPMRKFLSQVWDFAFALSSYVSQ